jgi:8-oxo-dGTP diphosphatase
MSFLNRLLPTIFQREKPDVGVAVWLTCEGQLMLGKRKRPPVGMWSMAGGKVDRNEPWKMTACREVEEETGVFLSPEMFHLMGVTEEIRPKEGWHFVTLHVHAALPYPLKLNIVNKEPEKCFGWEFFSFPHLPKPLMKGTERMFLEQKSVLVKFGLIPEEFNVLDVL